MVASANDRGASSSPHDGPQAASVGGGSITKQVTACVSSRSQRQLTFLAPSPAAQPARGTEETAGRRPPGRYAQGIRLVVTE